MSDERILYSVTVTDSMRRQEWLRICGERETVLAAAIAVILDNAPPFNPRAVEGQPSFHVTCWRVKA